MMISEVTIHCVFGMLGAVRQQDVVVSVADDVISGESRCDVISVM